MSPHWFSFAATGRCDDARGIVKRSAPLIASLARALARAAQCIARSAKGLMRNEVRRSGMHYEAVRPHRFDGSNIRVVPCVAAPVNIEC